MHIRMIEKGAFDVEGVAEEIAAQPYLWNTITHRTEHPKSPHREVDDIWVRYNSIDNYHGDMQAFNEEHVPRWYDVAEQLPHVKALAVIVAVILEAEQLGAVLITRIPPGKQVYPHVDGGWHARTFDKFCVQIRGNLEQAFCFEGEELRTEPGDLFWFDNSHPHWVVNPSDSERVSLIVCVRRPLCH